MIVAVRSLWAISAVLVWACRSQAAELPTYQLGDVATADAVAPVPLIVLDRAATDELRQSAAVRPGYVVRFQATEATRAQAEFRAAVSALRSNFLVAMRAAYPLTKVTARNLPSKRFRQLTNTFQQAHPGFPLDAEIVRHWALGLDDAEVFGPLAEQIRSLMERPILPDDAAASLRAGDAVQLVHETGGAQALVGAPAGLGTLSQARADLVRACPATRRPLAEFAATFLKANCAIQAAPPSPPAAWHTERFVLAYRYEAGDVIVRRGERVDARALAALTQLRERAGVVELQQQVAASQTRVGVLQRQTVWLVAGVLTLGGVILLVLLRLTRRHAELALVEMQPRQRGIVPDASLSGGQSRGLGAERPESVRRGLVERLSRLLSTRVVQTLMFQRRHLLEAEREAAVELQALIRRLEEARAPLSDRLAAYERRIAELERELAQKEAENHALLKAKIHLTRLRLQEEKASGRERLN